MHPKIWVKKAIQSSRSRCKEVVLRGGDSKEHGVPIEVDDECIIQCSYAMAGEVIYP